MDHFKETTQLCSVSQQYELFYCVFNSLLCFNYSEYHIYALINHNSMYCQGINYCLIVDVMHFVFQ